MLSLYHANDLESLGELACALLAQPPADPLAVQTVLVPSRGMGRWLTLALARRAGIVMQLDVQLPSSFIWSLARELLGQLPEQNAFATPILGWRLYDWLCDPNNLARTPRLAHYLEGGDERRRLTLAGRIADVFDQYLQYRDDWLAAWERGERLELGADEDWQALLWQELTRDGHPHRARLLGDLLARLETTAAGPERLVVFGISSLPPQQLRVLQALARHREVVIFALNPCREAWGDIRDIRELARLPAPTADDWLLDVGHPLLASLGKQGRDFFDVLFSLVHDQGGQEQGIYAEELVDDSLLHALQNDVLALRTRAPEERLVLDPADRSVELHVCHSPLREVEVLHDQLLARFAADPSLTPDQVVVLTPDIERYAPYISAVFGRREGAPYIPYSLADRSQRAEVPLIEAFLALLELPGSRFAAEELMGWLEQPAIARRAGIEAEALPLLRDWLRAASIRWGRDAEHRAELGLPADEAYSWRQGLDRLLLGFAAPPQLAGEGAPLLGEHWPLDVLEGARSQLLGALAGFLAKLQRWARRLAQPHRLADWADVLVELIDEFFDEESAGETLVLLAQACNELREQARAAQIERPLELALVRQRLVAALEQSSSGTGFLTGQVTFCTMVPMRSLPFRWVCLLGLDDGALPRRTPAAGFDLIARHPRRGDRARRLDDRYLMLETLLSARDGLYLSYVGRDPRDNAALPPSVLVSELLDTLDLTAVQPDGSPVSARLRIEHPLQPFAPGNFARGGGFATSWHRAAQVLAQPPQVPAPVFAERIGEPEALQLEPADLIDCMSQPTRYLLEQRLGVRLARSEESLPGDEPFAVERENLPALRRLALEAAQRGWDEATEYRVAMAAGLLPTGALGQNAWGQLRSPIQAFAPLLAERLPKDQAEPLWVEAAATDIEIRGWLDGVTEAGLFGYRLRRLGEWDLIPFWLRHLLLNIARDPAQSGLSQLISPENAWSLPPLERAQAVELLTPWLDACRQACLGPLPFFPRASLRFARRLAKPPARSSKTPLDAARDEARVAWEGNEYFPGEGEDACNALVFRDREPLGERFEQLAEQLGAPIFTWLEES